MLQIEEIQCVGVRLKAGRTGRLKVVGAERVALVHVAGGEAAFEPFLTLSR